MRKTKVKQRFENAARAFFAGEELTGQNAVSLTGEKSVLRNELSSVAFGKYDYLARILKQGLFYFPGTFLVFASTMALSLNYFIWQPQNLSKFIALCAGSLLMIGGIGNLKNPKHLIIPLSVIAVYKVIFVISLYTTGQSFLFNDSIYFLPLILIMPFLAKGWIDAKS